MQFYTHINGFLRSREKTDDFTLNDFDELEEELKEHFMEELYKG